MKVTPITWLLLITIFFCFQINVKAQSISGPDTACLNQTTHYHYTASVGGSGGGGSTYVWKLNGLPVPGIIYGSGADIDIYWVKGGPWVLDLYRRDPVSGALTSLAFFNIDVIDLPKPYVTTNFRVACQSFDTVKNGNTYDPFILSDSNSCIDVCDSNLVTYFVKGGKPGDHYSWDVVGGSILSVGSGGLDVTVLWHSLTHTGALVLVDTNAGGCYTSLRFCINIIPKPNASFTMNDRMLPYDTITICEHSTVLFHDQSTSSLGSLITSWNWDFGDGTSSSLKNPTHKYNSSGTYHAQLTVTNACGCTSKFKATITVTTGPAPRIECPTVVCQGDSVRYTTPDGCPGGTYLWSCSSGGTPLTANNLSYYVVRWDTVNSDGFGTVSLTITGCASICEGTTVSKVPIVQIHPAIQGPSLVCTGTPYQFTVPLWPATRYNWGVIDHPTTVISGRHSNTAALLFDRPGTYVIHVADQNSLRQCGSDVKDTITVQEPPRIIGAEAGCAGSYTYTLSTTGLFANWYLRKPGATATYDSSINSSSFTATLNAGLFILSIKPPTGLPAFCIPTPKTITISSTPNVDLIEGDENICLGKPYTYKAGNRLDGYSFDWQVVGGIATRTSGESITVRWTSPTGSVTAYRVMEDTPYCRSTGLTKNVYKKRLDTCHILGPSVVCNNSFSTYSFSIAEDYDTKFEWSLPDPSKGSITNLYYGGIYIFWPSGTGVPDTVVLTCKVTTCDTTVFFTKSIITNPPPAVTITATPDTICENGGVVHLQATSGGSFYNWVFGDGKSRDTVAYDTISHNYGPGIGDLNVTVLISSSSYFCPMSGLGIKTIVRDNPNASIYTNDPVSYCNGATISTTLQAITHGTPLSYQWFKSGSSTPVGTSSTYTATALGTYFLVYTDHYSCPDTTNSIVIAKKTCSGTVCTNDIGLTLSGGCTVISATGSGSGSSPLWTARGGTITTISSTNIDVTYDHPGVYDITFSEVFGTCRADTTLKDTIVVIPDFSYKTTCVGSIPLFDLSLHDASSILPGWSVDSIRWRVYELPLGTLIGTDLGSTGTITGLGSNTDDSIVQMVYLSNGANTRSCSTYKTIHTPQPQYATIRPNTVTMCEGNEVFFDAFLADPLHATYSWHMGDGFNTNALNFNKTYAYSLAHPFATNESLYNDTLFTLDTSGCLVYDIGNVYVYQNLMFTTLTASSFVACPGGADTIQLHIGGAYSPVASIAWSDDFDGIYNYVTKSGSYIAWVQDSRGCVAQSNTAYAEILPPPELNIVGRTSYCEGEKVRLANRHLPHYGYQWLRDSVVIDTSAIIHDIAPVGTHVYWVIAIDSAHSCPADTSSPDTVVIHPLPLKPFIDSIIAIDCSSYRLKISVADTLSYKYIYNWSNGNIGPFTFINDGGGYRVWRTDTFGCISFTDTTAPYSPESWLAWFPNGCYWFCDQSAPDTVFGPPSGFTNWQWQRSPGSPITGSGLITPYSIGWSPTTSILQLYLDNGLCSQTSDTMNIAGFRNCQVGCPGIFPNSVTIVCDTFNPGGYQTNVPISLNNPSPTDTIFATISLHIGPSVPFNLAIPPGPHSYMLYFTTLTNPPPSSTLLTAIYNFAGAPNGCYDTLRVTIPYPCGWASERKVTTPPGNGGGVPILNKAATAMLVYPNPAQDIVNVNYVYDRKCSCERNILIYDELGRIVFRQPVQSITGTVTFPTQNLMAGVYIIRMTEAGIAIETARLSVTH